MKKFRNEWKYICPEEELVLLRERLSAVMMEDDYAGKDGTYAIRSLYFDDYTDTCARDTEAGVSERYKWRIRYYAGGASKYIHLERKEKKYGRCFKRSCALSAAECRNLTAGEVDKVVWRTKEPLLQQFCAEMMMRRFMPKVIVEYERVAFVEPVAHIRVTLDTNIAAGYKFERFLDGNYQVFPLQEKRRHVLEVKFDDILPSYLRDVVAASGLTRTTFSKYYLGRKKLEEVFR